MENPGVHPWLVSMKLGLCGPTWISLPKLRRWLTMKAEARNLEAEDSLHLDS